MLHCPQVGDLQAILRDTSHNGYPVVRDSSSGQICLGLISRAHLLVLLQQAIYAYDRHESNGLANGSTGAAQHAQLGNIRRMPHQSRALLVLDVHPANIPQLRWRRAPSVRRASIIRWRSKAPAPTATPRPNSRARRTAIVRLSMTGIAARTRSKVRARPPAAQVTCVLRKVLTRKMSTATA